MDFTVLNGYLITTIIGVCLCLGYILKKWVKDVDNKYIPTILAIVGMLLNIWISKNINIEIVLSGMLSGLTATGLHQSFKSFIEKGDDQ